MADATPTPSAPAPNWIARNHTYIAWLVAILSSALASYLARQSGQPIPAPPPLVVDVLDQPDDGPPAVKRGYGWTRPPATDVPERTFSAPAGDLPAKLHLMAPVAPAVPDGLPFDQGALGSCGPHAAAALLLYTEAKAGRKGLPPPSRLFVYYATRARMGTASQDSGVSNATMFRALALDGWCDEPAWPYRIELFRQKPTTGAYHQAAGRKVTTAESVPQRLDVMKACLASGKPFVCGFNVYQSFETRAVELSGVVPMPRKGEALLGGHDVLAVGYDDKRKAFRFLNSYGPDWGASGFGWLPYSYVASADLAGDFWTVSASGRE